VPLAVWPVAQTSAQYQRAGRYHPDSTRHPGKMLPALAARIVAEYTTPGQLVVDPMCGIGTTLVEAAVLGRRAVGVELEAPWVALAEANIDHALAADNQPADQPAGVPRPEVQQGDARHLPELLGGLCGAVDLVVVSPPYGCEAGVIDKPAWRAGQRLCPPETLNYSTDRGNLGHARGPVYAAAMAEIYAACHTVLRPGGLLVTVTKNTRRGGRCLDLAGLTVTLARSAGFAYLQHVVALLGPIRDGQLSARPSFWQLTQTRKARQRGEPAHLGVHEDVGVFQAREVGR
jgi:tRNA G10  N-methylase Trm11